MLSHSWSTGLSTEPDTRLGLQVREVQEGQGDGDLPVCPSRAPWREGLRVCVRETSPVSLEEIEQNPCTPISSRSPAVGPSKASALVPARPQISDTRTPGPETPSYPFKPRSVQSVTAALRNECADLLRRTRGRPPGKPVSAVDFRGHVAGS